MRNAAAHPGLSALAVSTAVVAALLTPALTAIEVGGIETRAAEQVRSGSTVLSITAKDRRPLSAARCEALAGIDGVVAAGGLIADDTAREADGSPLSLLRTTPGYPLVLWPSGTLRHDTSRSVVVGSLLGERAGLHGVGELAGLTIAGATGTVLVDQVAAPSPRNPFVDRALVVTEPASSSVVECLVEAEPGARAGVEAVAVAWFPADLETTTAPFLPGDDSGDALHEQVAGRLSRLGPPLGAMLCAIGLAASWLARRAEFALYRGLGISTARLLLALSVETALTTLVGVLVGVGAAVVVLPWTPLALHLAALDVGGMVLLLAVLPVIGLAVLPRGNGWAALRGR